jgi:hypothetical protein
MKNEVYDNESKQKIENNLNDVKNAKTFASRTNTITRKDFLDLNYRYLVLDNNND